MSAEALSRRAWRILISAGEVSGDQHGARLLDALRGTAPGGARVEAFGIGGERLASAGLRPVADIRELSVMGIHEVLLALPRIWRVLRRVEAEAARELPDFAITIDYPDFHRRLARRLSGLGCASVCYIPPKTWVWRRGRAASLPRLFKHILCIFPFEPGLYAPGTATFVGNPVLDSLPRGLSREAARARLGLAPNRPALAVFPGSRAREISRHLGVMLDSALRVAIALRAAGRLGANEKLAILVPVPNQAFAKLLDKRIAAWCARKGGILEPSLRVGDAHACLAAADAAIVKSGTSTLEAALLGCPHAVVYRAGWLAELVFQRLVRYAGPVSLPNIVAGNLSPSAARVVPELIAGRVDARAIAEAVLPLFLDPVARQRQLDGFREIRGKLEPPSGPGAGEALAPSTSEMAAPSTSEMAAKKIWEIALRLDRAQVRRPRRARLLSRTGSLVLSLLWSSASALARALARAGALRRVKLGPRVVSVGNLQAGGAGKTPLVALAAREAAEKGKRVCILTRGYRSEWEKAGGLIAPGDPTPPSRICGDEAALLHELAPSATIAVGADREASFLRACARVDAPFDLVLMDDGFQSWKIVKDVEILALTSKSPADTPFRDFPWAAKHADLALWTKGEIRPRALDSARAAGKARLEPGWNGAKGPVWLVTGVGDGGSVLDLLESRGLVVERWFELADHAAPDAGWARGILERARDAGCRLALTEKDWVKWREAGIREEEVLVLRVAFQLADEGTRRAWERAVWGIVN